MEIIIAAIIDIVLKSGFIIVPLFLLGLFGWQCSIDVWIFIYKIKRQPQIETSDFNAAIQQNNFAIINRQFTDQHQRDNVYYHFLKSLYDNRNQGKRFLSSLYEDLCNTHLSKRFLSLVTIKKLAQASPLLGLLGTVNGMITTFTVIAVYGNSNPVLMADGISEALLTTQAGITIAFPLMLVQVLLRNQLKHIQKNLNSYFNTLYQTKA